jgi:DNA-binding response OmpR family regulator
MAAEVERGPAAPGYGHVTKGLYNSDYFPLQRAGPMPTGRRARILVVDDDEAVRSVLVRALVEDGYEVVEVNDRREAVAATNLESFHLVITNVSMPGLTGEQMAAELRRRFPGLPILHLDDLAHPLGAELPLEIRSLAHPFSVEGLLAAVAHVLKERA